MSRNDRLKDLPAWLDWVARLGVGHDDSEDERLQKASLTLTAGAIVVLAVVWVVIYASLGLYVSAAIPLVYQVVTIVGLVLLARTGRFDLFRDVQLSLILALPVLLQWSLGGFSASSGVILWAVIAPIGALVLVPNPLPWFWTYLALMAISGVLEPFLTPAAIPGMVIVVFFVLNLGAVSTVVYFLLRYFIRGLERERQRSERLLLNVLPAAIARRLKAGEHPIADRFDEVAVLFADLVDFTPTSERLAPEMVVELLDDLFSEFDSVAERLGLEKIKTIGDAYMVVGGLPEPRPDAPEAVADMALELQERVARFPSPTGQPLSLRIGIDVGPVAAGVIGSKKFQYDLWGDTVNTASRMESQGVPGQIQVTPRAYERLSRRYEFQAREAVQVKGKGEIRPYLMIGRRAATPSGEGSEVGQAVGPQR